MPRRSVSTGRDSGLESGNNRAITHANLQIKISNPDDDDEIQHVLEAHRIRCAPMENNSGLDVAWLGRSLRGQSGERRFFQRPAVVWRARHCRELEQ